MVSILKWSGVLGFVWLAVAMGTRILLPSSPPIVALVLFAGMVFGYRRWWRHRPPKVVAPKRINPAVVERERLAEMTGAERVALASKLYGKPTFKMTPDELAVVAREQREAERLITLRGLLAYDLETQQTWNYDGTRKTPREQVVATMDTYTFEVTEAKYRVMQEFFDDALEPGVYTFKKERSGPVRIEQ